MNHKSATIATRLILLLAAPLIASAQNVYVTSDHGVVKTPSRFCNPANHVGSGGCGIAPNVMLYLPPGNYVLNAKTWLQNNDGDAQSAACRMWVYHSSAPPFSTVTPPDSDFTVIDHSSVRLSSSGSGDMQSVALQAVYTALANDRFAGLGIVVGLQCYTYNGVIGDTVLTAIQVGNVHSTGCPVAGVAPPGCTSFNGYTPPSQSDGSPL